MQCSCQIFHKFLFPWMAQLLYYNRNYLHKFCIRNFTIAVRAGRAEKILGQGLNSSLF
jgi:hypothetical protein